MIIINPNAIKKSIKCNKVCKNYLEKNGYKNIAKSIEVYYFTYNKDIENCILKCPFYLKPFMKWEVVNNG